MPASRTGSRLHLAIAEGGVENTAPRGAAVIMAR